MGTARKPGVHGARVWLVLWWRHTHLSGADHSCQVGPKTSHPIPRHHPPEDDAPVEAGASQNTHKHLYIL